MLLIYADDQATRANRQARKIQRGKRVWERDHCGRKLATRRGMSVHHARDAACNDRETEHKRSCQNFVIFPTDCKAPR